MDALRLAIAHTWDGAPVADGGQVEIHGDGDGLRLVVDAPFHGDPPPDAPPGPTDRLWEHEVVELFIAGPGDAYLEVELGPHGHHLVLRLEGVRQVTASGLPLRYAVSRAGARWRGEAIVPGHLLPPGPHRVAGFAIHGVGPGRRYLSEPPLPGPRPDFHQPHRFPSAVLPLRTETP